jgi:hypothetical protein
MDGYAEPPARDETEEATRPPRSGYVDMYEPHEENSAAGIYVDDGGKEAEAGAYAVHDGTDPAASRLTKKKKKKERKEKERSKRKSHKAKEGKMNKSRDFAIDDEMLKREREEQDRLARFDPYTAGAADGSSSASSSVYSLEEDAGSSFLLPFFSSSAPTSAYVVPSAAAAAAAVGTGTTTHDVNASAAYGSVGDDQATSSVYAAPDGTPTWALVEGSTTSCAIVMMMITASCRACVCACDLNRIRSFG